MRQPRPADVPPADYAASLLKVALLRPCPDDLDALLGLPIIARRGTLETRVKGLIDPLRKPKTAAPRVLAFALAVLFVTTSTAIAAIRFGDAEQAPAPAKSSIPFDPSKLRDRGPGRRSPGNSVAGAVVRAWTGRGDIDSTLETRSGPDGRFAMVFDEFPSGVALQASNADGSLLSKADFPFLRNPSTLTSHHKLILEPPREITIPRDEFNG